MSPLPFPRRDGDDVLARRVARGDEAACSALFHRYHPRLELYCRSITRNDADAQDAAQSALAKAFAALGARTPDTALRPWLFRIAHNEAVSVLRRRRPEGEIADDLAVAEAGPAQSFELHEELRAVLADVRELPPRARRALLLRELADLDYAAVGAVLGITPGGARQAVFEARLALQADRAGREAPCERTVGAKERSLRSTSRVARTRAQSIGATREADRPRGGTAPVAAQEPALQAEAAAAAPVGGEAPAADATTGEAPAADATTGEAPAADATAAAQ